MLRDKKFTIFFSIILAVLLWGYVVGEVNPLKTQTFRDIPIEILNAESLAGKGLAVASNVSFRGDIVLQANRMDFINMNRSGISLSADLSGCSLGENVVSVKAEVPRGFTVYELRTPQVSITLDELVAVEKPVTVSYTGSLPAGKEPSDAKASPEIITLSGAKAIVGRVMSVNAEIDYASIPEGGGQVKAELAATGAQGHLSYISASADASERALSPLILSSSSVNVYTELLELKEVELIDVSTSGKPAEGYELESFEVPATVWIKGRAEDLSAIEQLTASDIDISGISESMEIALDFGELPEGVYLADSSRSLSAIVNISNTESKGFVFDGSSHEVLRLENTAAGASYEYDAGEIEVLLHGVSGMLELINEENIELYIDASEFTEGENEAEIKLRYTGLASEGGNEEEAAEEEEASGENASGEDASEDTYLPRYTISPSKVTVTMN